MINNDLDLAASRRELHARGRVQVRDFLQPDAADRLHACLRDDVPWHVAERGQPSRPAPAFGAPDPGLEQAYDRARTEGFHFAYDRYLMVEALKEGCDPELLLHSVVPFFNGPQFLEFIRWFGNDPAINMVGAQATRYRHGQLLRLHNDHHAEEGRRYAYVLNLSRDWEADWGGLLQFVDAHGNVVDTFVPRFNSLSLFKVPFGHVVTPVTPWATQPRLAITGWWHAKAA